MKSSTEYGHFDMLAERNVMVGGSEIYLKMLQMPDRGIQGSETESQEMWYLMCLIVLVMKINCFSVKVLNLVRN